MNKKLAILFIFTGIFGAFSSGAWAYIFWQVRTYGQLLLREPNYTIITAELVMATIFTLVCLVAIVVTMRYSARRVE